ncbi:MAG: cation transporting ATPase C-terminal domain-containing protein [Bacteroidales bacterium]|nr:cation transporting ATPase C-terminal domain-containing protein [Bacteroidales bacterium]
MFFVSLLMTAGTIILFNLHYSHSLENGLDPAFAQAKAQTSSVTFVILFQIFYMLNCRSLKDSLLKIGFFSNPVVFLGIGIVLGLQAVFIYAPFMQSIFNTVPLTPEEILFAALFGFAIFPVIGIEKWIHSLLTREK